MSDDYFDGKEECPECMGTGDDIFDDSKECRTCMGSGVVDKESSDD